MAASKLIETENLSYWVDGSTSASIKLPATKTENLTFWFDGKTYAPAFKQSNVGTMMPFFWGI